MLVPLSLCSAAVAPGHTTPRLRDQMTEPGKGGCSSAGYTGITTSTQGHHMMRLITELKTIFPIVYKKLNFPIRENNILNQVCTNIPGTFKAIMLAYPNRFLFCRKIGQVWSEEAISLLQDCFEITDWDVFAQGA